MVSMTPSETKTITARTGLVDFLTEAQQRDYRLYGWFDVTGSEGRRYRLIGRSFAQSIQKLNAMGNPTRNYCCHIHSDFWVNMDAFHYNHDLIEENLLALFLMITLNEREFLRTAH